MLNKAIRFFREHDAAEIILITLITAITATAIFFFGVLTFTLIDSRTTEQFIEQKMVIGRDHTEGYFQAQVMSTGKTTTTTQIWIPDSWSITIDDNGYALDCSASEYLYDTLRDGEMIDATMSEGRMTGKRYCLGVE
ncbi:hypothetical protein [Vibrio crassostreae]|uniref:hypothetical protein n=1 Tax=Vibrio crassostreae TaxID=246167 RepID=UPI001B30D34B|nr:hypothetical protein [Vibrio crassostreae]